MKSVFTDKNERPNLDGLQTALGETYKYWQRLHQYSKVLDPSATEEWKYSGEKFGWSFRISDRKRVLIYLLPRDGFFKAALVFGPKAIEKVFKSDVAQTIKDELVAAKPHAEGRGIRIDVRDSTGLDDIEKLLAIKFSN